MKDIDDVFKLLSIAEKALQFPKLRPIHDAAVAALEQHAEEYAKHEPEPEEAVIPTRRPNLGGSYGSTDSE